MTAFLAVFLLFLHFSNNNAFTVCASNTTLHLIAVLPMGNKEATNCLDLGEELIPAAQIAAKRINSNPNLLADFTLEILSESTDLTSFMNQTIVGVIGIVCPAALFTLSPEIANFLGNFVQITSSTASPSISFPNREGRIDRLYQIAPTSTIFNEAMIALMKINSWKKISVIRNTDSIGREHDNIARDFRNRIEKEQNLSISLYKNTTSGLDALITEVSRSGVRIIYASVTGSEARELLFKAYLRDVSWPHYLWVLHSHSLEDLLYNTTECSMQNALEGVLLLHHVVNENSNREIDYADYTYGEYKKLYTQRLQDHVSSSPTCNKVPQILSANALHDSVLAFAYALNQTLAQTSSCDASQIGETLNSNLESLNFNGAGGEIGFDNVTHELTVNSPVSISQIFGKKLQFLGVFNNSESITYENSTTLSGFSYTFDEVVIRLPLALPVFLLIVDILCILLTIVVLVLFIYYRGAPYIKATSPLLSYVILTACFMLYANVASNSISAFIRSEAVVPFCVTETWLYCIGLQLLFVTLFLRLLRVYTIFNINSAKPVGKAWSDIALILYIGASVLVTVFLLALWTGIGNFRLFRLSNPVPSGNPPRFEVELVCHGDATEYLFTLLNVYAGVFMVLVIIFAILTRKVSIDLFKDTKAVNIFVVGSIGVLVVLTPISYVLVLVPGYTYPIPGYLLYAVSQLSVCIMCVSLLFIPKIYRAHFPIESTNTVSGSMGNRSFSDCNNAMKLDANYSIKVEMP